MLIPGLGRVNISNPQLVPRDIFSLGFLDMGYFDRLACDCHKCGYHQSLVDCGESTRISKALEICRIEYSSVVV